MQQVWRCTRSLALKRWLNFKRSAGSSANGLMWAIGSCSCKRLFVRYPCLLSRDVREVWGCALSRSAVMGIRACTRASEQEPIALKRLMAVMACNVSNLLVIFLDRLFAFCISDENFRPVWRNENRNTIRHRVDKYFAHFYHTVPYGAKSWEK